MSGGDDLDAGERAPARGRRSRSGPLEHITIGGPGAAEPEADADAGGDADVAPTTPSAPRERDPLGKMALFSSADRPDPPFGSLLLECSSCRRETPVSPIELVRAALPCSLHLFFLRDYPSLMRCPACGRRTWLRIRWRL